MIYSDCFVVVLYVYLLCRITGIRRSNQFGDAGPAGLAVLVELVKEFDRGPDLGPPYTIPSYRVLSLTFTRYTPGFLFLLKLKLSMYPVSSPQ